MDFNVILNNLENASNEDKEHIILYVCNEICKILYKPEYNSEDKRIIQEYLTSGMYKKSITEGIKNTEIRKLMIDIKNQYVHRVNKDFPELQKLYTNDKILLIMLEAYENVLLDKNEIKNMDINTHEQILSDFLLNVYVCGIEDTFKFVDLYRERVSIEQFKNSSVLNTLAFGLFRANRAPDSQIKEEKLNNFYNFAQEYIADIIKENGDIDFTNNVFLREFLPEQSEKLKGFWALNDIDKSTLLDPTENLNHINAYISDLLKKAFETPNYKFTPEERVVLINYFSSNLEFFMNSIKKYPKLEQTHIDRIFEYLYKIEIHSLDDHEETIFLMDIFEEDLISNYESLSRTANRNCSDSQVLVLWKANCDSKVINKYIRSMRIDGLDPYKTKVMEAYAEDFIENIAKKKDEDLNTFDFKLIKKYFNNITKRNDFNIFNEQYICDILQLIYTGRLPDDMTIELGEILEKRCHISKIDVEYERQYISEFINDPENQVVTDENKMDEFVKHLGNLKLTNYRISSQAILDFVLKQPFFKDSAISNNPDKYRGLIERCLEDLGRNDLPAKINQDRYVYFIRDSFSRNPNTIGTNYYSSRIYIKRSIVDDFINHDSYEVLETIFHENEHALQDYEEKNSTYNNYYKYLMTKEGIIRTYNPEFYRTNYKFMFIEIYARIAEVTKMVQFLKRIEPIDTMQLVLNDLKNTILMDINDKMTEEFQNLQSGKFKRKSEQNTELFKVEDLFDEIILQYPVYISIYPKLKAEYNEDGTLKRIGQILSDIDSKDTIDERLFYLKILQKRKLF